MRLGLRVATSPMLLTGLGLAMCAGAACSIVMTTADVRQRWEAALLFCGLAPVSIGLGIGAVRMEQDR